MVDRPLLVKVLIPSQSILNIIQMADVSLDDLIKKDKEKKQTQREERRGSNRGGKVTTFVILASTFCEKAEG